MPTTPHYEVRTVQEENQTTVTTHCTARSKNSLAPDLALREREKNQGPLPLLVLRPLPAEPHVRYALRQERTC